MNDLVTAFLSPSKKWKQKHWNANGIEYYDDQWGNIWYRKEDGSVRGEIYKPALERWSDIKKLRIPDYDNVSRYEAVQKRFHASTDKFKIGVIPGWVFDTSRYLRKMEIYLCDLLEHREKVDHLNSLISDLLIKSIACYAEVGADAIVFYEDMGTQTSLLISPTMWRDVFKTHYARLVCAAHDHGLKVFMHSCGQNWELLDDLIKVGIDCFNFDQPAAYNMEALAAKLKASNVGLWSPIDIQRYLPTGNKELIQKEARRMIDLFQGNLILKSYSDLPGIGVQYEWEQWAYDAFVEYIEEKYK